MKVCKGVKRDKTDHLPIVFDDGEGYFVCPVCEFIKISRDDAKTILEMHEKLLGQEDYIAKIEVENTKLKEKVEFWLGNKSPDAMFQSSTTVTITEPTVKPTKSTKKKTTKKTT